jgi:hypothetical protein
MVDTMRITEVSSLNVREKGQRGAALVLAISLLALFSFLGTIFVKNMGLHLKEAQIIVDEIRAAHIAAAGVQSAIAELAHTLRSGATPILAAEASTYDFPTYTKPDVAATDGDVGTRELGPGDTDRKAAATVTISADTSEGGTSLRYRILSESAVSQVAEGIDFPTTRATVETLIQFKSNGEHAILFWNTQRTS